MIFILGGNGTHAGANAIHNEVLKITSFFCYGENSLLIPLIWLHVWLRYNHFLYAVPQEEDESIGYMCSKNN